MLKSANFTVLRFAVLNPCLSVSSFHPLFVWVFFFFFCTTSEMPTRPGARRTTKPTKPGVCGLFYKVTLIYFIIFFLSCKSPPDKTSGDWTIVNSSSKPKDTNEITSTCSTSSAKFQAESIRVSTLFNAFIQYFCILSRSVIL